MSALMAMGEDVAHSALIMTMVKTVIRRLWSISHHPLISAAGTAILGNKVGRSLIFCACIMA
jgi:hypothetical protein